MGEITVHLTFARNEYLRVPYGFGVHEWYPPDQGLPIRFVIPIQNPERFQRSRSDIGNKEALDKARDFRLQLVHVVKCLIAGMNKKAFLDPKNTLTEEYPFISPCLLAQALSELLSTGSLTNQDGFYKWEDTDYWQDLQLQYQFLEDIAYGRPVYGLPEVSKEFYAHFKVVACSGFPVIVEEYYLIMQIFHIHVLFYLKTEVARRQRLAGAIERMAGNYLNDIQRFHQDSGGVTSAVDLAGDILQNDQAWEFFEQLYSENETPSIHGLLEEMNYYHQVRSGRAVSEVMDVIEAADSRLVAVQASREANLTEVVFALENTYNVIIDSISPMTHQILCEKPDIDDIATSEIHKALVSWVNEYKNSTQDIGKTFFEYSGIRLSKQMANELLKNSEQILASLWWNKSGERSNWPSGVWTMVAPRSSLPDLELTRNSLYRDRSF